MARYFVLFTPLYRAQYSFPLYNSCVDQEPPLTLSTMATETTVVDRRGLRSHKCCKACILTNAWIESVELMTSTMSLRQGHCHTVQRVTRAYQISSSRYAKLLLAVIPLTLHLRHLMNGSQKRTLHHLSSPESILTWSLGPSMKEQKPPGQTMKTETADHTCHPPPRTCQPSIHCLMPPSSLVISILYGPAVKQPPQSHTTPNSPIGNQSVSPELNVPHSPNHQWCLLTPGKCSYCTIYM